LTRNPLRVKLVGAVLALVAVALIVIGSATAYFVNGYLLTNIDSQLNGLADSASYYAAQLADPTTQGFTLPSETAVAIMQTNGRWVAFTDRKLQTDDLPAALRNPLELAKHVNQPMTEPAPDGKYRWRLLPVVNPVGDGRTPIVVAQTLSTVDQTISRLVFVEIMAGAGVLIALALAGAWMVRASLRPLAAIERTAAAIAGGDLTQRVPPLDPRSELGQLSGSLNLMLSQIEGAFRARAASEARAVSSEERMRQFVADASHELRTPLTTIRGFAELYRQGAAPDPSDVLRRIEDEAARMGLLVEDLLLLARLDEARPMQFDPVHVAEIMQDSAEAARAVAPERTVTLDLSGGDVVVSGDEGRLRQVIGNLVTNALTHTPPGTPIILRLRVEEPNLAVMEVSDEGPGLTDEQARRVFERFYRVDKARTRNSATPAASAPTPLSVPHNGSGLGLAIVAALVAAHRGSVEVETAPGRGATFRVRIPIAQH